MSKRRTLKKRNGLVITGKFEMEKSRIYIMISLLMFHIAPLFCVFMGETGKSFLPILMIVLNPIFLFMIGLFYAVRNGFDWKFPLITTVLSAISIVMYYDFETIYNAVLSFMVFICVYAIIVFVATVLGGILRRMFV